MTLPKNKIYILISLLISAAIFSGCDDSKDEAKLYEPELEDKMAPEFSVKPQVISTDKTSVTIEFAIDEPAAVVTYIVESREGLALTTEDLFIKQAEESGDANLTGFNLAGNVRRQVVFNDLKPGTAYQVYVAARDKNGLSQSESEIVQVVTLPEETAVTFSGDPEVALQTVRWVFKPQISSEDLSGVVLENAPEWLQWDKVNREVVGVPDNDAARSGSFSFTLKSAQEGFTGKSEFTVEVKGDPLYEHAWHMKNTGQKAFAYFAGQSGIDINLEPATAMGLTGKGVKVRVADSGMQIEHPDLKNNINSGDIKPFINKPVSPPETPVLDNDDNVKRKVPEGDHGTSVGGIIAAEGWNGIGSRGVAPKAALSIRNILSPDLGIELQSRWFVAEITDAGVDVVNQSFGPRVHDLDGNLTLNLDRLDDIIDEVDRKEAEELSKPEDERQHPTRCRENVGTAPYYDAEYYRSIRDRAVNDNTVFVKAAGNGHEVKKDPRRPWTTGGQDDANFDPLNTVPYNIVVGAINANGVKSSYSTAGSSLWISAPGGEYGHQSAYEGFFDDNPNYHRNDFTPAIITTDFTSVIKEDYKPCQFGYAKKERYFRGGEAPFLGRGDVSGFNLGTHPLNPNCDYTATMNGTSAAAPIVSGVIALMLERNPKLTWRDVKHILAATARKIDPYRGNEVITAGYGQTIRTLGWVRNNAGYNFHNWYGFGLIDAGAAVEMANPDTYVPLPEQSNLVSDEIFKTSVSIPDDPEEASEGDSDVVGGRFWNFQKNAQPKIPQINAETGGLEAEEQTYNIKPGNLETSSNDLVIEALQVKVNIKHENMSGIGIMIESPHGTKSMLVPPVNSAYYCNYKDMIFTTNAFYGETAVGQWKMRFVDVKGHIKEEARLQNVAFKFWGYAR